MKCKYCNGTGYNDTQRGTVMTEFPPCPWCGGSGYIKDNEQTNEEWFATLSTEEKAKTIANATYSSAMMGVEITALPKEDEVRKWKRWLKQPHIPQKQDDYPCNVKGCSLETRQACCGCPNYFEWEKQHKE